MKQALHLYIPLLTLLLMLPGPARAQTRDPARSYSPPCLRAELEQIAFLEGSWDVISRKSVGEGQWQESRARATWKPILGGCALQEHWSGTLDGEPMEWVQLLAYDHRGARWQQVMLDWAHGNVITSEGHATAGGLVFSVPHMRKGRLLIDRTTIRAAGTDRVAWTLETSPDGGQSWVTFWTMVYTRR